MRAFGTDNTNKLIKSRSRYAFDNDLITTLNSFKKLRQSIQTDRVVNSKMIKTKTGLVSFDKKLLPSLI